MSILATIPPPPGNVIELGPLTVHYYGIAIAVGVLLAITLLRRRFAALGGDPELADRVGLWAVGMGFVGARLAYVSTNLDSFFPGDPLGVLRVWEGGLAFFGGLLFGTITGIVLIHRWGGSIPDFADAAAPCIPLAQIFGRLGNYFNQELFGTPTDLPWALEIERGGQIVQTVHPTFLYEMIGNALIVAVLIAIGRRRILARGALMFVYVIGYGALRFSTELIRTDTDFRLLGISRNGYVALLIILIGIAGLRWRGRRGEETLDDPAAEQHDAAAVSEADNAAEAEESEAPAGATAVGSESIVERDAPEHER